MSSLTSVTRGGATTPTLLQVAQWRGEGTDRWVPPEDPPGPGQDPPAERVLGAAGVAVVRGDAPWPPQSTTGDADAVWLGTLEPVGVGGVLDGGFDLLRSHFGLLVGLAAALLLPLQLIDLWASLVAGLSAELDTSPLPAAIGSMDSTMPVTWMVVVLRFAVLSFLGVTTGVLVGDSLADRVRPTRSVVAAAGRRWWVALLVPVLCIPVKAITSCLIYVGFFLGDALLMCASVVAGAESAGPLRSFGRSWALGWRSLGTALGVAIGSFVISAVLQVSLYAGPVLLASFFVSSESMLLVVQQITMLSLLVTQPLTAAIAARAYVEFRCRSEALDIALRRRDLGLVS